MEQQKWITREELHELVWRTPMSRLSETFGLSGNGLAKICQRLDVPYPPRGHWANKAAGKPVVGSSLPPRRDGVPKGTETRSTTPPSPRPDLETERAHEAKQVALAIEVPKNLRKLHPIIEEWLAAHRKSQEEARRRTRDRFSWHPEPPRDLTARDKYRFRVTSALLTAVEKAGASIDEAQMRGRLKFTVDGETVDCVVVGKMTRPLKKPESEAAHWTAFPHHHQTGLHYTGFLRIEITTLVGEERERQWQRERGERYERERLANDWTRRGGRGFGRVPRIGRSMSVSPGSLT